MAGPEDIVAVMDRQGIKLVRLRSGTLLHEPEVEALGRALAGLADVPGARVVMSFLGVQSLTSLVLGQLIRAHKRLAESGGELRLADIDPHLYEVFSITRLDRLFKIYEREADALASFGVEA